MVIRKPLKVLVCLSLLAIAAAAPEAWTYTGSSNVAPGIQGDALSAEPLVQPSIPSTYSAPRASRTRSSASPVRRANVPSSGYSAPTYRTPQNPLPAPRYASCPPQGCAAPPGVSPLMPPLMGLLSPFGVRFASYGCVYLPRARCKQFELDARLWYAKLNASTMMWGTNLIGGEGTELDLHNNLGLRVHEYLPEYEIRCKVRDNWGIRYSFMPIRYRDNSVPSQGFYFGSTFYPAFTPILTIWDRYINRWDLVYDWYQAPHAVSSLFAGYRLYDEKLSISNFFQSRTRSSGFGLASVGISIERAIRPIQRATVSTKCEISIQFLEGYFGWDGYAAGRVAVPMECGRFGYLEAGWRWIVLQRDDPGNINKTSLDGLMGTVGLIF
ncbi:MAG: hypothetical protein AB1733_03830 [Thermodesulfobacteriota bacterium]